MTATTLLHFVGLLMGSAVPIIGAVWAWLNRTGLTLWALDKGSLVERIRQLMIQIKELRAENSGLQRTIHMWESGARASDYRSAEYDTIMARLDRIQTRFDLLIQYAKAVMVDNASLRAAHVTAQIPLVSEPPAMPELLREVFNQ